MAKITFMGAGSTVFAKNILGDSLMTPALRDAHIALYEIDGDRLRESKSVIDTLNVNINESRATVTAHLGVANRRKALADADFVVNAIQVGGYKPSTVIDFEIPKKFGLKQTIGDTLGIGGIFRAMRTIPVVLDFARDMEDVCPNAWFLNYVNPMAMITGAVQRASSIRTVGLCHSVQAAVPGLLGNLGMKQPADHTQWKIAGINHMAWLLEVSHNGRDLYPEIKRRAAAMNAKARNKGAKKHWDMVRYELMRHFGYYITESSEHNAEYSPYWIKATHPGLIEEFNIPIDEYPRRCVNQIKGWKKMSRDFVNNPTLRHDRGHEYGSYIMEAITTGVPTRVHGNVINNGLIANLPREACVEVPCLVDRNGVQGCSVGALPQQCAGLNMTNINVQFMAIEAAFTGRKEALYHAAMLDPHTASELPLDKIRALCDALISAHGSMMPRLR
jgi:alpha-galactosidase